MHKITSHAPHGMPGSPIGHLNKGRSRYWFRSNAENLDLSSSLITAHVYTLPSGRFLTFTRGSNASAYDLRLDHNSLERLVSKYDLSQLANQGYASDQILSSRGLLSITPSRGSIKIGKVPIEFKKTLEKQITDVAP